MDPWYDYLALPIAPLVLLLEVGALALGQRARILVVGAGTAVIAAMFISVASLPFPGGDPNIGAGLLLLELGCSMVVLAVAIGLSVGSVLLERRRARLGLDDVEPRAGSRPL